jgi:hypothetical protein
MKTVCVLVVWAGLAFTQIPGQKTTGSCSPVVFAEGNVSITYQGGGCLSESQSAVLKELLRLAKDITKSDGVTDAKLDVLSNKLTALNAAVIPKDVTGSLTRPLEIQAFIGKSDYAGPVYDIQWDKSYVETRVYFINRSSEPIEQLDLWIGLDTSIAAIRQTSNVPDVVLSPYTPYRDSEPFSMSGLDESGKTVTEFVVPLKDVISTRYRVYCPRLLSEGELGFMIAAVALNPVINGEFPKQMFAPKRNPQKIRLVGSYLVREPDGLKRFKIDDIAALTPVP